MLHVRNFLRAVQWTGEVPGLGKIPAQEAKQAMGRAARMLLENIGDLLPSRKWEAGVRDLEKSKLSGQKYEPSTVRAALRTLRRAGLVETHRTRDHKSGLEGYSIVNLSPALVALARKWQILRLELKDKGTASDRKKIIQTELLTMQNVNLPFLYDHPGNPHEQCLTADPLLNLSTHRCSKLVTPNTGIHTPLRRVQGVGMSPGAPGSGSSGVPLPPPSGEGGVALPDLTPQTDGPDGLVAAAPADEGGRYSDVVKKSFDWWKGKRREFSAGRLDKRRSDGRPVRPAWQPDARPHLQEWFEDKPLARHDAPGSKILIDGDQSIFFEVRAFAATLDAFHGHKPGHTTLSLVRPDKTGRMPIFVGETDGLWRNIDWQSVFRLAWAKSRDLFLERGIGEQIFGAPGEKSRMILIDDLKTEVPIFEKTSCTVLKTSEGNYQHLYCASRALTRDERHHIQKVLVGRFGGDTSATGGAQPHRIPGSTNYKPGRGLFVCRLVGTVGSIDGGKPLPVGKWLREPLAARGENDEQETRKKNVQRPSNIVVPSGGTDTSASGQDWRKSIVLAGELRVAGHSAEDVRGRVESMLIERAEQRGKNVNYYVGRTLLKLTEAGHL